MVDMDLSNSSSFNEVGSDSPGTITAPETPPSYWSGSDTGGPIKTPKSTGKLTQYKYTTGITVCVCLQVVTVVTVVVLVVLH